MIRSHYKTTRQAGFTLIELMVVIVIAAILMTIAVPSFQNLIMRSNVDGLQARLSSAISTARTEAASRNTVVTICARGDDVCTDDGWNDGWLIFEDRDASGAFNGNDVLIDVFANDSGYTITGIDADGASVTGLSFNSQGFLTNSGKPTLLMVCEPNNNDEFARAVFVNTSGLVMKTRDGNDAGGRHDNPLSAGSDLDCP